MIQAGRSRRERLGKGKLTMPGHQCKRALLTCWGPCLRGLTKRALELGLLASCPLPQELRTVLQGKPLSGQSASCACAVAEARGRPEVGAGGPSSHAPHAPPRVHGFNAEDNRILCCDIIQDNSVLRLLQQLCSACLLSVSHYHRDNSHIR